jgi:Uma2 family endonuclease
MTPDEYLAGEREQPVRHEYARGEVFAMAGGSMRHNALRIRMGRVLDTQLQGRCAELNANDVLTNPTLLVEVLSSSTEQYDRGLKWEGYQRIEFADRLRAGVADRAADRALSPRSHADLGLPVRRRRRAPRDVQRRRS